MPSRGAIVSLLPAATEIVCALGEGNRLSAVSHECDYPARAAQLAKITSSRVDATATSTQIFMDVERLIAQGLSIFEVDAVALRRAAPRVILTQTQCGICAATPADLDRALARWLGQQPKIVSMTGLSLAGIWNDFQAIGAAIDAEKKAEKLIGAMKEHFCKARTGGQEPVSRPTVGVLEWTQPLMGAGNWMPELIELAGGIPAWGESGAHSPWLSIEEIEAADPDVLLLVPCGLGLEAVRGEAAELMRDPGWRHLRAVREGRLYCADGSRFFNRPGPRLRESLDILVAVCRGREGPGVGAAGDWERVSGN